MEMTEARKCILGNEDSVVTQKLDPDTGYDAPLNEESATLSSVAEERSRFEKLNVTAAG